MTEGKAAPAVPAEAATESSDAPFRGPAPSYRLMQWITCKTCGKRALVRAGGKGFCSKKCIRGVNVGTRHAWKGPDAGYWGNHRRIYRARGKANHCEQCGQSGLGKRYEWAWIHDTDPGDPQNYRQLCAACHKAYDGVMYGSNHPNALLTEEVVREIRVRYAAGDCGLTFLSREYGVSAATIDKIVKGRAWKHVA